MTFTQFLALAAAAAIAIGLPAALAWTIFAQVTDRDKHRERPGGGGGNPLSGMFMELDRVVRPSVEHVVEAENRVLRREDDQGDPPLPGELSREGQRGDGEGQEHEAGGLGNR